MDKEILEWFGERPEDWRSLSSSVVYTWGNDSNNQLGHSTNDNVTPAVVSAWQDTQMVRQWSACDHHVTGTVVCATLVLVLGPIAGVLIIEVT